MATTSTWQCKWVLAAHFATGEVASADVVPAALRGAVAEAGGVGDPPAGVRAGDAVVDGAGEAAVVGGVRGADAAGALWRGLQLPVQVAALRSLGSLRVIHCAICAAQVRSGIFILTLELHSTLHVAPRSRRLMDPSAHREDWAASPIPPLWTHNQAKRDVPSVDPAAHTRVRAFPSSQDNQEQGRAQESGLGDEKEDRDDDNDDDDGDNQESDLCTELKALPPSFQLVAPQPRRVVSPELIFLSAAESLSRHKRLRFSAPNATLFRPIVADRPDLEITSPPMRSANPVVMDSRFQGMTKLDLQRDAKEAPVQPFYPRATRRFPPRS